jgi:hypothetical protein
VYLEITLDHHTRFTAGQPFLLCDRELFITVHLEDARTPLDDLALIGPPEVLDRLAEVLARAAAAARAFAADAASSTRNEGPRP